MEASLSDTEAGSEDSICLLRIQDGVRLSPENEGILYCTRQLFPDDFLSSGPPRILLVEAMKKNGFIVYELKPGLSRVFHMLTCLISSSILNALLFRELQDRQQRLTVNLESMRKTMAGFIQTMSATIEKRDPYTAGHQRRVSDLARSIAQEMGLAPSQIEAIRMASLIHDLGEIYVPSEILNRTGILDEMERGMIQRHPRIAYDILKNIEFPWPIADIVHQHHERLDGSGYPGGLKGDQILMEARIIAVADVVEAMSSRRPYRAALGMEKALDEINRHRGTLYDPAAVDACTGLFRNKRYNFHGTDYLVHVIQETVEPVA
jgi:HD-GYP domain-containing protein (c-di-GMP phosphodiesterase class II)